MLADLSREIHTKMRRLKEEVDALFNGGWQGKAAAGFAQGWDEWHAGATEVLDALKTMGSLLDATGRDYGLTDDNSAEALQKTGADL
jgi:WXG100 family type VII secretion target